VGLVALVSAEGWPAIGWNVVAAVIVLLVIWQRDRHS
jgi:hypothetical protein